MLCDNLEGWDGVVEDGREVQEGGDICISEVIDISPSNLDSSLCFLQSSVSHDVLCIEVK